ncbi:MAG: YopX family protein [Nitrospiria bacterium]
MREIRFRAWDKKLKKMREPFTLQSLREAYDGGWHYCSSGDDSLCHLGEYPEDENFEIMQYTGIRDKNGKEIYEGDIVKVTGDGWHKDGEIAVIEWHQYGLSKIIYRYINLNTDLGDYQFDNYDAGRVELEVIGTIYENSELLK